MGYVGGRGAGTQWESSIASAINNKVDVHRAPKGGLGHRERQVCDFFYCDELDLYSR